MALEVKGNLKGFVARGAVIITLNWALGKVTTASLEFPTSHFWHNLRPRRMSSSSQLDVLDTGFYSKHMSDTIITIISPNPLKISPISCATIVHSKSNKNTINLPRQFNGTIASLIISIPHFPCTVLLQNVY